MHQNEYFRVHFYIQQLMYFKCYVQVSRLYFKTGSLLRRKDIYSLSTCIRKLYPLMKVCDTLPTDTWLVVANPILECSVHL